MSLKVKATFYDGKSSLENKSVFKYIGWMIIFSPSPIYYDWRMYMSFITKHRERRI